MILDILSARPILPIIVAIADCCCHWGTVPGGYSQSELACLSFDITVSNIRQIGGLPMNDRDISYNDA
jgi:hypothetical protein